MNLDHGETECLLSEAAAGNQAARQQLLERYRERLNRMVALRLDPRVAARVDPADVVQEALVDAARKLGDYLKERPLPFYLWLRRLAIERSVSAHRHHHRDCRDVWLEAPGGLPLTDESAIRLVDHLAAGGPSPSGGLRRAELRQRLLALLARLPSNDREVLVMRYLEELSFREIAEALDVTENTVKLRHFRALERVRKSIDSALAEELLP